jgi:hypothetical protein
MRDSRRPPAADSGRRDANAGPPTALARRLKRLFLWQIVRHIPKGTAVDPDAFPEDAFPVQCLECGYSLRGLPDGNCPECGTPFERGVVLVDMYARGRLPRYDRARDWSWRLRVSGFVLYLAPLIGASIWRARDPDGFLLYMFATSTNMLMAYIWLPLLLFLAAGIVSMAVHQGALPRQIRCTVRRAALERVYGAGRGGAGADAALPGSPPAGERGR